jgi:hypothetical protein
VPGPSQGKINLIWLLTINVLTGFLWNGMS